MIAHQGGWDELLIVVSVVLAFLAISAFARRRRSRGGVPSSSVCAYCGRQPDPGAASCPSCGFRRAHAGRERRR